jgi:hypothetical protein
MKRITYLFKDSDIKILAYKIIMIQVRYIKSKNMNMISEVYDNIQFKSSMDWICQNEEADPPEDELSQKDIAEIYKEFNIRYYWQNLEKMQKDYDEEAEGEGEDEHGEKFDHRPLAKMMEITHPYYKLFSQCPPLTEEFKHNYQQWLEEEVWGYYD